LKDKAFWLRPNPNALHLELLCKDKPSPTEYVIQLVGKDRTYNLCCMTAEDKVGWCKHLDEVIPVLETVSPQTQMIGANGNEVEGYLYKTNPLGTHWDRRWFVLNPCHMTFSYYEAHNSRRDKPRGGVDLSGFDVQVLFDVDDGTIASLKQRTAVPTTKIFQLRVGQRTFSLCADSEEELRGWCNALAYTCACEPPNFGDGEAVLGKNTAPKAEPAVEEAKPAAAPANGSAPPVAQEDVAVEVQAAEVPAAEVATEEVPVARERPTMSNSNSGDWNSKKGLELDDDDSGDSSLSDDSDDLGDVVVSADQEVSTAETAQAAQEEVLKMLNEAPAVPESKPSDSGGCCVVS